jgi:hydroxyacylglutathione hydrolase
MILELIPVGPFLANCYIIGSPESHQVIIVDPGADYGKIKRRLDKHKLTPAFIINTHGHIDHIGEDASFKVPIYIHQEDLSMLSNTERNLSKFFSSPLIIKSDIHPLNDNQDIRLDEIHLKVIHTPGHTPGGICLLLINPENKILFSGDTLLNSGIGRTDFPGASESLLIKSIKDKLFSLDDHTVVYPGHGPQTTIGREKKENPFF